ncbi:hypothetical protein [Psychrobacter sp. FDAARGOS_221]|uniref:hypothetical protein n=1 Tax=Psychrobacter sp. FDAARGOS_221 TaxID=1975705 RepID=UPI000BB541D3|nr:hypothetical protein [Psychrobacter sp. FDAARGOS_221]PNK59443.1 hypothetical protein A6J60_000090 [Psychrobacter sp. FDAARGOS_221]PNK61730.1 hypothetical protein A6J60_013240 [Psychrobacter sp. FDAARGOS_221]
MSKTNNLPKHIAQMVEKNNLVLAIKELAAERNISMSEAKTIIDDYEQHLKQKQAKKVQAISDKQHSTSKAKTIKANTRQVNQNRLISSVDNRLDNMGYQKPMIPYWMKRLLIILLVCCILIILFYWKFVK